jgi:hypothetical protein
MAAKKSRAPSRPPPDEMPGMVKIVSRFVTRNGRRVYKKDGGVYSFWVPADKVRG